MIILCTDFGLAGPYVGQVKAVLARQAPGETVIDLFADLPPFRPQPAAYLLAAYAEAFVAGDVILAVVDPG
ncbi:MAG: SAM-dependent chlorinase/fluorinase, partial [Geminicoccaceae bacterium]